MEKNVIKEKPKSRLNSSIHYLTILIPTILFILSIVFIILIWIGINSRSQIQQESIKLSERLHNLDNIKFSNAELTDRINVISDVLARDQNISSIIAFAASQISDKIIKIENISKSFDGTYELKVAVSSIKDGTDLYQKLSEVENIQELKLVSTQKIENQEQYSFTISFKYKDGLSAK